MKSNLQVVELIKSSLLRLTQEKFYLLYSNVRERVHESVNGPLRIITLIIYN